MIISEIRRDVRYLEPGRTGSARVSMGTGGALQKRQREKKNTQSPGYRHLNQSSQREGADEDCALLL